jgi:hypothetical protein
MGSTSTKTPPGHPSQLSLLISEIRDELIDPEIRARLVDDLAQMLSSSGADDGGVEQRAE